MKNRIRLAAVTVMMIVALATPAFAGIGMHAGMSLDPDDFLFGLRFQVNPIAESLYLVPIVEVGLGDITMIAGDLDVHYQFKTNSELAPYAGAGITLNWFDYDRGSDTKFGGSVLGGISLSEKFFFEAKIGLGDVPDWKLVLGWHR